MTEKFKLDEEQKKMVISHYKDSLDEGQDKIKEADKRKNGKKTRNRELMTGPSVRLDAGLEESMFIMSDMIKSLNLKVTMKK